MTSGNDSMHKTGSTAKASSGLHDLPERVQGNGDKKNFVPLADFRKGYDRLWRAASRPTNGVDAMQQRKQIERNALNNALNRNGTVNYQRIFDGFVALGVPEHQIEPRVNIFTFNAWRALGRTVRKGEHGVMIFTVIPCTKKDPETGAETLTNKRKAVSVFHISQTEPLDQTTVQ